MGVYQNGSLKSAWGFIAQAFPQHALSLGWRPQMRCLTGLLSHALAIGPVHPCASTILVATMWTCVTVGSHWCNSELGSHYCNNDLGYHCYLSYQCCTCNSLGLSGDINIHVVAWRTPLGNAVYPNTMQASPILFQMWVLLYHIAIFRHRFIGYGVTTSGSEQESLAGSSQYGNEP